MFTHMFTHFRKVGKHLRKNINKYQEIAQTAYLQNYS